SPAAWRNIILGLSLSRPCFLTPETPCSSSPVFQSLILFQPSPGYAPASPSFSPASVYRQTTDTTPSRPAMSASTPATAHSAPGGSRAPEGAGQSGARQ